MASNTATARLRELSVNANGIMRAITVTDTPPDVNDSR